MRTTEVRTRFKKSDPHRSASPAVTGGRLSRAIMLTTTEKGHATNPVKDKEASIALITDSQPSAGRAWDDHEQAP